MEDATPAAVVATVVITTKNRKEDLRNAIRSALRQDVPIEVLVIDDASTDGTSDLVRREFPSVRLETAGSSQGYIVQRNRGARLASGPVIFSIDDDAIFTTPHVVRQTLADFDHPRVGAVAIPFININQDNAVRQKSPEPTGIYVAASYIGTAHAVRRDLFLKLGGYREFLFHQGEEADFCIRMLDAGYVTRLGTADPIHHFESPRRDHRRIAYYGHRNNILFAWHNAPATMLPLHVLATTCRGFIWGIKTRSIDQVTRGLVCGYGASLRAWRARQPVRCATYRLHRHLKNQGVMRLGDLADFPPDR